MEPTVTQQLAALLEPDSARMDQHEPRRDVWFAPMPGGVMPQLDAFERVTGCDLSTSGIALLMPGFVRSERLVVSFGPPMANVTLVAKVIWQARVAEGGPESARIGCHFVRRL